MVTERRWSPERDRELARRYTAGETLDEIAAAFAMPTTTIRGRVSTLGLLRRKTKKAGDPGGGNAPWLLADALNTAFEPRCAPFATDLLAQLDAKTTDKLQHDRAGRNAASTIAIVRAETQSE